MVTRRKTLQLACVCVALSATPLALRVARAADSPVSTVDTLARNVERAEAIRAVKNLQYAYTQYAQFGLWADLGSLFTDNGETIWGDETIKGSADIAKYNMNKLGGGKPGLPPGVVNNLFVEVPLVNLSVDGNSARG